MFQGDKRHVNKRREVKVIAEMTTTPPVSLESNALINDSNLIYHYSQVEEPSGIIYSVSYTLLPPILSSVLDPPSPPADTDTRTNHPFFLSPFFN